MPMVRNIPIYVCEAILLKHVIILVDIQSSSIRPDYFTIVELCMYPVVDLALKLDSADYEATETHFDLHVSVIIGFSTPNHSDQIY